MDRNITITVLITALIVGFLCFWGWRKVMPATMPGTTIAVAPPSPTSPTTSTNNSAVLSAEAPTVAATPDQSYWLWDGALLATRSLDDLTKYQQENDRPPAGYPNGTSRNEKGQTPNQRELLMAGYIIEVPEAARVDVLAWDTNDLAQVRVREGKRAGSVGWINKHLLRFNHNGVFDSAFPVQIQ